MKEKKRKTAQAGRRSLHGLRKGRHIGPKCRPSPMEKMTSGDLEGGWQPPAPDQGLESILLIQVRVLLYLLCEHDALGEHAI